jgi:hypothetical protein
MTAEADEVPQSGSAASPAEVVSQESRWKSTPMTGLIFAIMTGLLVFFLLQNYHPFFQQEDARDGFGNMPEEIQERLDWQNASFVFGLLGALTAAGVAVAEGFRRKSILTIVVFGVLCTAGGAVLGAAAGYAGNLMFQYFQGRPDIKELNRAIYLCVSILGMVGAGVGISIGVLLGRRIGTALNCFFGGLLAGVGAGFAYPVLCALAIPGTDTNVLIPIGQTDLLLWCCLTTVFIGMIIPALATKKKKKG